MSSAILRLRAIASLLREPPWPVLLTVSLLGWLIMARVGHDRSVMDLCVTVSGALADRSWRTLQAAFFFSEPTRVALSWILMLAAMMSLVLAPPIRHICDRSLRRRQPLSLTLFLGAYFSSWLLFAPFLVFAGILLQVIADLSGLPTIILSGSLVACWQATPWKQRLLNLCHWTPRLSLLGWKADRDCLRYGMREALLCIGTCWALMLLPLSLRDYHLLFMAGASVVMVSERLRPGRRAQWHIPRPANWVYQGVSHLIGAISTKAALYHRKRSSEKITGAKAGSLS